MCDNDLEEQTNEFLVLKEICGTETVQLFTSQQEFDENLDVEFQVEFFKKFQCSAKYGGRLDISPILTDDLTILWTKNAT